MKPILRAAFVLALFCCPPAMAQGIRVIDGDTIEYSPPPAGGFLGFGATKPKAIMCRLVGFDTPETFKPTCPAEKQLGMKATARLSDLVKTRQTRVLYDGRTDKYGRTLCRLEVNGKDVGPIMIAEGLAHAYGGRVARPTWCK